MTGLHMFRTDHGDGRSTPTGLTIHGSHGGDLWVDLGVDLICLTPADLTVMGDQTRKHGTCTRAGVLWDESDAIELTKALRDGPTLDDCANGCEGPGLVTVEGRVVCPGCVAGYGAREDGA